ncbi:MAG: hypothetical protein CR217_00100 [Beijerinckiaceae bacterium]|nr:MAG: hypothetical protein CR217_00100 [Beijerinckiaceae bacterium]
MSLLIVGSYPKRIVDYVRLRKSAMRLGVDMQAIVSAICGRAGHELRACLLSYFRFRCWAARRAARAPRCEKVAAFAGEHRNPPRLEESRGSYGGQGSFSQKLSRFVAGEIFQSECCRLCKIAQIGIASGR